MRQDLGSGKPMLHYQDIPVFISDFVSSVEQVHKLHSAAASIVSMNPATGAITLSADISAQITASLSGIISSVSASTPIYAVVRAGSAGKYRKLVFKITDVTAAVITADLAFSFLSDELNKKVATNTALLTALNSAQGLIGRSVELFERIDGTSIYAGKFGEQEGICAFTMSNNAGIMLKYVGPVRERDEEQYRMKWYVSFQTYSRLALARLKSVLPL
jgi:hypothetical protein